MAFWKKKQDDSASTRPLVVVVDDELDLCEVLEMVLNERGVATRCAHNGREGLDLIRASQPDLVMLDIKMPQMNGYQVLSQMQNEPALACVPVIVMTSLSEEADYSDQEWARRLGVCHFVTKPYKPDAVGDKVLELLGTAGGGAQ